MLGSREHNTGTRLAVADDFLPIVRLTVRMTTTYPLFSILVPAYNAERFLGDELA